MSTPEVGATELPPVSVPVDVVMGDVGHGDTGVDAAILNGAPPTTGSGKDEFKEGPVNAQSLVLDGGEPSGAGDGDGEHDAGGTDDQTAHTAGAKRRKMNTPHSVYLPDDRGKSTAAPLSKDTDRSAYAVYPMDVVPAAPPAPPDPVAEEPVKKRKRHRNSRDLYNSNTPLITPRFSPGRYLAGSRTKSAGTSWRRWRRTGYKERRRYGRTGLSQIQTRLLPHLAQRTACDVCRS